MWRVFGRNLWINVKILQLIIVLGFGVRSWVLWVLGFLRFWAALKNRSKILIWTKRHCLQRLSAPQTICLPFMEIYYNTDSGTCTVSAQYQYQIIKGTYLLSMSRFSLFCQIFFPFFCGNRFLASWRDLVCKNFRFELP